MFSLVAIDSDKTAGLIQGANGCCGYIMLLQHSLIKERGFTLDMVRASTNLFVHECRVRLVDYLHTDLCISDASNPDIEGWNGRVPGAVEWLSALVTTGAGCPGNAPCLPAGLWFEASAAVYKALKIERALMVFATNYVGRREQPEPRWVDHLG
jgi:hypothetical protein